MIAKDSDQQALETALAALQATANQFAAACIKDSAVRTQYVRDLALIAFEYRNQVKTG